MFVLNTSLVPYLQFLLQLTLNCYKQNYSKAKLNIITCDFAGIFPKIFRIAIFQDVPEGQILSSILIDLNLFQCYLDVSGPSCQQ